MTSPDDVLPMRSPGLERRIRSDIEARIRAGDWRPGDRLPTEQVLMAQYGCARMTVSKAIGALADAGLVTRNKKAGTLVAHPHVQTAVLEIPDIAEVIARRGETYEFRLLARRVRKTDPDDAREAALGPAGPLLAVRGLHVAGGAPFAVEDRVIHLTAVPEAEAVDFSAQAPGSWLLKHVPWTEARHRISAAMTGAAEAKALDVKSGYACLQVERWTFRLGQGVTFVRQLFPHDRFDLVADFRNAADPAARRPDSWVPALRTQKA
jgi:GntR family transcriptional regulator, histidine utilization repressor